MGQSGVVGPDTADRAIFGGETLVARAADPVERSPLAAVPPRARRILASVRALAALGVALLQPRTPRSTCGVCASPWA